MGTPISFLVFCWSIGVQLSVDGDFVRYDAPVGLVSDELLDLIRHHKPALHSLLSGLAAGSITESEIRTAYLIETTEGSDK